MSLQPLCPKQKKGPMTAPPPHFSDQLGEGGKPAHIICGLCVVPLLRACECATIRGTRTRDGHGRASTPSERRIKKAQRAMDGGINAGQLIVRGKEKRPNGGGGYSSSWDAEPCISTRRPTLCSVQRLLPGALDGTRRGPPCVCWLEFLMRKSSQHSLRILDQKLIRQLCHIYQVVNTHHYFKLFFFSSFSCFYLSCRTKNLWQWKPYTSQLFKPKVTSL